MKWKIKTHKTIPILFNVKQALVKYMTRLILKYSITIYLLFTSIFVFAQESNNQNIINRFIKQDIFQSASIGIEVRDLKTNQQLAESNADKSLTPASTQKLITTATALEILGSDFQFKTDVYITGHINKEGILMGNLIIRGFGDPSLGSKYFPENNHFLSKIYTELKKLGIKQISGKLIADNSFFKSSIPRTWIWEDIGNYYGAVPHPISYKDNTYTLHFESKEAEQLTQIKSIDNKQADLEFINEVVASTINRDRAFIFGGSTSSQRRIEGTIPQNRVDFQVKGATDKPHKVLLNELETNLRANGIAIQNKTHDAKTQKLLLQFKSPALKDIVAVANMESINLFTDHLLFQIGYTQNKKASWESGIKAIKEFWQTKGIDSESLFLYDGSGLSHFNAISAKSLNQVISHMNKSQHATPFNQSLAIAGESGTLKNFGKSSLLSGNFKAKTGSMTGVRAYSGILNKTNGQQLAISLIINNYTCSTKVLNDKTLAMLLELITNN